MFLNILIVTLLLAFSTAAKPVLRNTGPVTLPISRHLNLSSIHSLVHRDQSRAKSHKLKGAARARFNSRAINEGIDNLGIAYIANIGIGRPATTYNLLIDTASANTWVGASRPYVKTSTTVETANKVAVDYGWGSFSGTEFTDTVSVIPGFDPVQSIGVASTSKGFQGFDGVLGLGPVDLTVSTLSPAVCDLIPTVTDNLFFDGFINAHLIALSFEPTTVSENFNGEITWGGTDSSKFTGPINFFPVSSKLPSSQFWGIDLSIRYGSSNILLSPTAGIIDTTSTLILISTGGFNNYKTAAGAALDNNTGLLRITGPAQIPNLQSLFFLVGGVSFELTPNAQIFPRALNVEIGGVASAVYLIVNDIGFSSNQGLDFVLGYTFLERFYTVLDTGNQRIGLATTPFTNATIN